MWSFYFYVWLRREVWLGVLLKALLEVDNTSKIVAMMGIKTCTVDTGVYGIRMVLKRRLVIYR